MAQKALGAEEIARPYLDEIRSHIRQQRTNNDGRRTPTRLDLGIQSSTINVPGDFRTIQDAINAAIDGDTIQVASGTYKETLGIIDKDLTLKGQGKDNTIIDGINSREQSTVFVDGGNINISGFTIKNGVWGLIINNSKVSVVSNNIIDGNKSTGLGCFDTSSIKISDNIITNTQPFSGVLGRGFGSGMEVGGSNITLTGNIIEKNAEVGVAIFNSSGAIKKNTIMDNNDSGLEIFKSSNIDITDNLIEGNGKVRNFGVVVLDSDTLFFTNNVIKNNEVGLYLQEASSIKVIDNVIGKNSGAGISVQAAKDVEISDNQITDGISSGGFSNGIDIFESSTIIIKGNNVSANDGGITVSNSIVEIVKNSVTDNNLQGVSCDSTSVITGCCNVVMDNGTNLDDCPPTLLECPCPVGNPAEERMLLEPASVLLTHIGAGAQLTAILESLANGATTNVTKKAVWSSSNDGVAVVNTEGLLTAVRDGEGTICAEFSGLQACIKVHVNTTHAGINQWTTSPEGEGLGLISDIAIDPIHTDVIYAGTNFGEIFKSLDGGEGWQEKSVGVSSSIRALAIDPMNPDIIYAGAFLSIYKSVDGGKAWDVVKSGVNGTSLVIDPLHTGTVYVGTEENGVLKSVDGGDRWEEVNNGLPFRHIREDSFVMNPANPEILYVAVETAGGIGKGVFKTTDGGRNWKEVNRGLFKDVLGLAIDPDNPDTLYAGTIFRGVFKTTNGGERWFELEDSPHEYNWSLAVDNLNPDVIYVGNLGTGIFMSRDAGQSWARFNTQLTSRSVFALKIDPIHPSTIYAGTIKGVFRLTNAFGNIIAAPNPDGTSIDIEYQFNKDTGIKPLGFNLYRSASTEGDFEKITDRLLDAESTAFNDKDFLEGATHVYRMTVVDERGETLRSFTTSAKPLLSANPDFDLEVAEAEKEVVQGGGVSYALNLSSQDNFLEEVFLGIGSSNLPGDVKVEFLPQSGVPPIAVQLNLSTGTATPAGDFRMTVNAAGKDKGGVRSESIILHIVEKGSKGSNITQTINTGEVRVGDKIEITGEIIPAQIGATVTTTLVSPDSKVSNETSITDEKGRYSLIKALDESGTWRITSAWTGNESFQGAASQGIDLFAAQAVTTLSMVTDAALDTSKGDSLTLSGRVVPAPGDGNIILEIVNLDGSLNFNSFVPLSPGGDFSHRFRVAGGERGKIRIKARFDGNKDFGGSVRDISLPIQEPVGMAIIVAGGGNVPENSLWKATNLLCNYAYTMIKNQGIPDMGTADQATNRILYLHPDPNNDADGDGIPDTDAAPSAVNLQSAIEDWAIGRVETGTQSTSVQTPLTIYMMGPGAIDSFQINKGAVISAAQLDLWLDNLFRGVQKKFHDAQPDRFPVNIIIESPQSGSFLDDLRVGEDGVGKGRTIVTSTDQCKVAGDEPCETGGINISGDGLTSFSGQFFFGLKVGKSITAAWSEANLMIRGLFDNQQPQLDADGDGIPNESDDENRASLVFISQHRSPEEKDENGKDGALRAFRDSSQQGPDAQSFIIDQRPVIRGSQRNLVVKDSTAATLWAVVEDPDDNLKDVQALLFPPKGTESTLLELAFSEANKRHEVNFGGFDLFGLYKVLFVARDRFNNTSLAAKTLVNSQSIVPAILKGNVFDNRIRESLAGAVVWLQGLAGSVNTDPNGNYFLQVPAGVYTVIASKEGFLEGRRKDRRITSSQPVTQNIGLDQVVAPGLNMIRGIVIDQKNHPIKRSKVKLNGVNTNMVVTTGNDGRYEFTGLAAGKYQIKVRKGGFITSKRTVEVKGGETVELDFQLQRG